MTVYFRPCGDITKAPAPRTDDDRAFYDRLSQMSGLDVRCRYDDVVDYEDWMEPAKMLESALLSGYATVILPSEHLGKAIAAPIAIVDGLPCRDILIGRQKKSDPIELSYFDFGWPCRNGSLANRYGELETFRNNAGRRVKMADMPGEATGHTLPPVSDRYTYEPTKLGDAMIGFAGCDIMIKQVYPAKTLPVLPFQLDTETSLEACEQLFQNEVGYHIARFEGDPAALLVQEKVTMTNETRFFVISGAVVTGAACIESNTPAQNPDNMLITDETEYLRNRGNITVSPLTSAQLTHFAVQIATEIGIETPALRNYTLDVALNEDGVPLIIELNPADNAGLYAIDAKRLFQAIVLAASRAPHRAPLTRSPDPCARPPIAPNLHEWID
jgi:hypothetical protein